MPPDTSRLGMCKQRNAMRTAPVSRLWYRRDHRAYDVELPKHCRSEDVYARAPLEKMQRDVPTAHMRGGTQARLPVARAPIPCRIDQRRLSFQQIAHTRKIAMGVIDEVLNQRRFNPRLVYHPITPPPLSTPPTAPHAATGLDTRPASRPPPKLPHRFAPA